MLGIGAAVTITYMVVQADPREKKPIPALPIACVSAIVTAGLLVVFFLDHPYSGEQGSVRPTEMTRTLQVIDMNIQAPCDGVGTPL